MILGGENLVWVVRRNPSLKHSAKGTEWEKHKYVKKINGVYYYPSGYDKGRTVKSLSSFNESTSSKNNSKATKKQSKKLSQFGEKPNSNKEKVESLAKAAGTSNDPFNKKGIHYLEKGSGGKASLSSSEITAIAKKVIRGKYGNGAERKKALGENYQIIQDEVNKMLLGKSSGIKMSSVKSSAISAGNSAIQKAIDKTNSKSKKTDAQKMISSGAKAMKKKKKTQKKQTETRGPIAQKKKNTGVDLNRVYNVYKK